MKARKKIMNEKKLRGAILEFYSSLLLFSASRVSA
jgi:hypothetical protein